jgi:hypothetical protein
LDILEGCSHNERDPADIIGWQRDAGREATSGGGLFDRRLAAYGESADNEE